REMRVHALVERVGQRAHARPAQDRALGGEVGDALADATVPELLLFARRRLQPVERLVEADTARDAAPLVHERARDDLPPLPLGAEAVLHRHPDVAHEYLVELRAAVDLADRADV